MFRCIKHICNVTSTCTVNPIRTQISEGPLSTKHSALSAVKLGLPVGANVDGDKVDSAIAWGEEVGLDVCGDAVLTETLPMVGERDVGDIVDGARDHSWDGVFEGVLVVGILEDGDNDNGVSSGLCVGSKYGSGDKIMRPRNGEVKNCSPDGDCVIPNSGTVSLQMTAVASNILLSGPVYGSPDADCVSTEARIPMWSSVVMFRLTGKGELGFKPECSNMVSKSDIVSLNRDVGDDRSLTTLKCTSPEVLRELTSPQDIVKLQRALM
eukprot:271976-Amorphochlora_amoeboformis.AAC.1